MDILPHIGEGKSKQLLINSSTDNESKKDLTVKRLKAEKGETTYLLQVNEWCLEEDAQLEKERDFYRAIALAQPDSLYVFDVDRQQLVFSQQSEDPNDPCKDVDLTTVNNEYYFSMIHPEDLQQLVENFQELGQSNERLTRKTEYRLKQLDGSYKWFRSTDTAIPHIERPGAKQIIGRAQDITEEYKLRQAFQDIEIQYRTLFEQAGDGLALHKLDGEIILANQKLADLLGTTVEEIVRKNIFFENPNAHTLRVTLKDEYAELLEKGHIETEVPFSRRDGTEFQAEIRSRIVMVGGEKAVQAVIRDITKEKKARESIRESEEKYRTIFEKSGDGIVLHDLAGNVLDANKVAYEQLGYTKEEFMTLNVSQMHPVNSQNREEFDANLKGLIETGELHMETQFLTKSGELLEGEVSAKTVKIGGRELVCGLFRNHTPEKKAEALIKSVFQGTSAFINVIDLHGKILYANRLVDGLSLDDYIGTSVFDWIPEDVAQLTKNYIEEMKIDPKPVSYEISMPDLSGEPIYYQCTMSPMLSRNMLTGVSIVSADITAQKKQNELQQKKAEIVGMGLDAAIMGSFEWDLNAEDGFHWDNRLHKIFGMDFTFFSGKAEDYVAMIHPDDKERAINEFAYAIKELDIYKGTYRIIRKNDLQVRWISFRSKYFRDQHGRAYMIRGVAWDVTKEKDLLKMEAKAAKLESQNEKLKQFNYFASHDLKSPLKTINHFVEILRNDYSNKLDTKGKAILHFLSDNVSGIQRLLEDLLTYSSLGNSSIPEMVNMNEVVLETKLMLLAEIKEKKAELILHQLPMLVGYRSELLIMFQNLISNALKFQKEHTAPIIEVGVDRFTDKWRFWVKDNGIGIPKEDQQEIFHIFKRSEPKTPYAGHGIGLANCQKIAILHEGDIWVESASGEGSTFYFTISDDIQPKKQESSMENE